MALHRAINAGLVIFVAITTLVVLLTGMFSTTNTLLVVYSGLIIRQYNETDLIASKSWYSQDNKTSSPPFYHPASLDQLWVQVNQHLLIRRLAYFDTRETSHHSVVFISLHEGKKDQPQPNLFSFLSYKNNRTKCVELEYWGMNGEKKYPHHFSLTWILRTMSSEKEIPVQAQISTDKYCHSLTVSIPILSNIPDKKLTYGVCLHQGLFGVRDVQILVDWVELNLALGAEIITIYLQDVPESLYNLLQPYIKKGVLEVLDWSLKPPLIPSGIYFYGQFGLINECIYRNLYRVKYLALIDVDEFIVPQQTSSVIEMLQTLEKTHQKAASYLFYNTLMYKGKVNLPEVKSANKCSNMVWPRYYTHTLRIDDPIAQNKEYPFHKIIVKPQGIISAWVHWVVNASAGYDKTYVVPTDIGLTFHYREPPGKKSPYFVRRAYYKKKTKQCFLMSHFFQQTFKGIKRTMCPTMY